MKNSFIMYKDQQKLFGQLTDEEAGKLIKAVFMYLDMGEINDGAIDHYLEDRMLSILFSTLIQQIDRDAEKYAQKCKKLRENGSKGGKVRAENAKQLQANVSLNDNDNDNDNDSNIPSLNELSDWGNVYARENKLNSNECLSLAQQAYEYYNMCMKDMNKRTWVDSKGKTIKNWKLKISRVWFKDCKPVENVKMNPLNVC